MEHEEQVQDLMFPDNNFQVDEEKISLIDNPSFAFQIHPDQEQLSLFQLNLVIIVDLFQRKEFSIFLSLLLEMDL
jgi:hypothetical protein